MSQFSAAHPEIGLSQMCRLAKRDKATTHRYLTTLSKCGLVEQNPVTKGYRLGPALLQLGRMRELTVPREVGATGPVRQLSELIGETVHVTVLSGHTVFALMSLESPQHSIRAVIDISTFPLHATASGICALAFGPAELFDIACETLDPFTKATPTTPQALREVVADARATGVARANGLYETEINSLSTPLFGQSGSYAGAVSVASVATRLTDGLEKQIMAGLIKASRDITRNWGCQIPPHVETAWSRTIASLRDIKETS